MFRRLLVGVGHLEQLSVVPHTPQERDANRVSSTEVASRHGDLREARGRAFLARPGLGAVTLQPALVRVRAGLVRRIEHRVQPLALHEVDEERAEALTARVEGPRRRFELGAGRRGRERALEPALTGRRHLARRDQLLDGDDAIARLGAT